MIRKLLILLVVVQLVSCGDLNAPENLDINKDFSMKESEKFKLKVPNYLNSTRELNDEAELQFENTFRETYLMVMAESKSDYDLARAILGEGSDSLSYAENYLDMQLASMEESGDRYIKGEKLTTVVNGMPAMSVEVSSTIEGFKVAFIMMAIEAEYDVLYATAWTLDNRKDKYFPTFYKSLNTIEQKEYDLESQESVFTKELQKIMEEME